jgi:hypothetical protein
VAGGGGGVFPRRNPLCCGGFFLGGGGGFVKITVVRDVTTCAFSEECAVSVFSIHFLEEGNVTCVSFCGEFSPVKLTLSYLVMGF